MFTKDEEGGSLDIDTEVYGDPQGLRDLGKALKQQANRFADSASDVTKAQAQADMAWTGTASDACHDHLGDAMTFGRVMTGSLDGAGPALETLGDELGTAQIRLHRALAIAHGAGLQVTGTVIHFPNEAAPIEPPGTDPAAQRQYYLDKTAYDARHKGWNEIVQINIDARGMERAAHEKFEKAIAKSHFDIEGLQRMLGQAVGTVLTFAGDVSGTTAAFAADATLKRGIANAAIQVVKDSGGKVTSAELGVLMQSLKNVENSSKNALRWHKYAKLFPSGVRKLAGYSLENMSKDLENLKGIRKVPVAGTVAAAVNASVATAHGEDPAKEWTKLGIDTAEGALVAELVAATIPGPGWAYAATAAIAIPVTHATDEIIDHWGEGDAPSFSEIRKELDDKTYNTGINQWHNHR